MGLSEAHRLELEQGSGITPGQIERRGYRTVEDAEELRLLGFSEAQLLPGLLIPLWGVEGAVCGYQLKPYSPRERKGKPIKYETPAGWRMRIDVGPGPLGWMDDPTVPLIVTEGVKKGDSAWSRGHACASLLGVWNWRGTGAFGGISELADWDRIALNGRRVPIVFDSDVVEKPPVRAALRKLAGMLQRRKAIVVPVRIPGSEAKVGLDDWFAQGGTLGGLLDECVDETLLHGVQIMVGGRPLHEISEEALAALVEANYPPQLFVRGGELVRVQQDELGLAKLVPLGGSALRGTLSRCASWLRAERKSLVSTYPPKEVVEDILSLPEWEGVPPVEAVSRAPVVSASGAVADQPGYDPESRFYIAGLGQIDEWAGDAASAAAWVLGDVLGDFPFAGDADRAHALALMLLPILRPAISGPTPLHLIDAPVQGTGKSLLARVLLLPTCGTVSATPGTRDEEEWRKKIAACLLEGRPAVFLDNLSRKVDSDSLAGALTSVEWMDRGLSTMRTLNLPVRCCWVATANNAQLSRDILRRTVWIRLDARVERPEDRKEFRHRNIEAWIAANRSRIVGALVRIVREWAERGMPGFEGRAIGSFEEWASKVGGALQSAGVTGFLGNLDELRSHADEDEPSWSDFYGRWWEAHGPAPVKAAALVETFEQDEHLAGMLGDKGERGKLNRLGLLIRNRIDVISGGYRVVRATGRAGSASYRLEPVLVGVDGAVGGTFEPTPTKNPNLFEATPTTDSNPVVGVGGSYFDPNAHVRAHTHAKSGAEMIHQLPPSPEFEPENGGFGGQTPTNQLPPQWPEEPI